MFVGRANFKFSLDAVRPSIIELVRSTCSANSCRKLRRSAATQSTFPDTGTPHVVSIAGDHRYSAKLWLFAIEIPHIIWVASLLLFYFFYINKDIIYHKIFIILYTQGVLDLLHHSLMADSSDYLETIFSQQKC